MCGSENIADVRPRHGALAALSPPRQSPSRLSADLTFHTPGHPSSREATHARLTPVLSQDIARLRRLRIVIHDCGDLGRPAAECGFFRALEMPDEASGGFVELLLREPLSLAVGGRGIIGRRVSLYDGRSGEHQVVLAEGIVGFNCA
ncbi:hypothetical protein GQ602_003431 [Ophiocordyceps camponoti-floridani]|uniref:Uncharacterized protein n=1 Tax=Ophiocordyceps camponoti-floridani TaxID=2030778 RepID=A0A8H4Q873_9HYPO|nr:hypothetical protein GQ602_003431 [Ophiocordyceps camponoti-floridani]